MGAYIGALYAREGNLIASVARAKTFSGRMGNIWRMLSDVTWPVVAYTTVSICASVLKGLSDGLSRAMNSIGVSSNLSALCILRTCGSPISVTPPTSSHPGWRSTILATRGDTYVSMVQACPEPQTDWTKHRGFYDIGRLAAPIVRQWKYACRRRLPYVSTFTAVCRC